MCRYLLNAPPKPEDNAHRLRLMFGNGMRPQIWSEFVKRFNIKRVSEFYGSSEGNANIGKIQRSNTESVSNISIFKFILFNLCTFVVILQLSFTLSMFNFQIIRCICVVNLKLMQMILLF